jgi:sterol 24-C-methyltransferase
MRTIARHSGARIVGVNNNLYQVWKGTRANQGAGLGERCRMVKADFLATPLADASFDGAYAFEATCHAPDARRIYGEVLRVLKPGGRFALHDWCLSSRYQDSNPAHRRLRHDIEEGNALPELRTHGQIRAALEEVGFEVIESFDRADECDPGRPWYLPLTSRELSLRGFQRSLPGRWATTAMVRGLESLRIAPRGATRVSRLLNLSADALVAAGQAGIFTPMHFFHARRPA